MFSLGVVFSSSVQPHRAVFNCVSLHPWAQPSLTFWDERKEEGSAGAKNESPGITSPLHNPSHPAVPVQGACPDVPSEFPSSAPVYFCISSLQGKNVQQQIKLLGETNIYYSWLGEVLSLFFVFLIETVVIDQH